MRSGTLYETKRSRRRAGESRDRRCTRPGAALLQYLPLVLLGIGWEVVARFVFVSSSALPSLSQVAAAWIELVKDGELITNGASSLYRAGVGLLLSIIIGAALGIFMAWWRPVNIALAPLVEMFYPMPKSALIPVTVISVRSMGAGRLRMMWNVVVPSAIPELLNGIRTALALAFILLVTSELIVARQGFGYLIGYLGNNGSYDGMFAVVLTVAFLGFAADRVYLILMKRILRWRE